MASRAFVVLCGACAYLSKETGLLVFPLCTWYVVCFRFRSWSQCLRCTLPWVGAFFDIGNHHSRGGAAEWLRAIGPRIVKLDVKGHSTERRKNCDIFDGDVPWEKIREEIARIQFTGWATAEVSGGGEARLRQVVQRMNRALGIG